MTSVCSRNTCAPKKKGLVNRSCDNSEVTKKNLFEYLRKIHRHSRKSDTSTSSQQSNGPKKSCLKPRNRPDTNQKSSKSTKSQNQLHRSLQSMSVNTQPSHKSACQSFKPLNSYGQSDESELDPTSRKSGKKSHKTGKDCQNSTRKSVKTKQLSHKSRYEPDNSACSRSEKQTRPTRRMENKKTQKKKHPKMEDMTPCQQLWESMCAMKTKKNK